MTDTLARDVRATLGPDIDEAAALDRISSRLNAEIRAELRPVIRRRRTVGRRTTLLFVVVSVFVVGGAAVAAPAVHRRLFGTDPDGAANRMEVFQSDQQLVDGMSVFDARQPDGETIAERMLLGPRQLRARFDAEYGAKLGMEHARRLLDYRDDIGSVQVVAVPTELGNLCYATMDDSGGTSGCIEAFDAERQVEFGQSFGGDRRVLLVGLASDDVSHIDVLVEQSAYEATMGRNAFVWRGAPNQQPKRIVVEFHDGTSSTITLPNVLAMADDPTASYSPDPDRIAGIDSDVEPDTSPPQ